MTYSVFVHGLEKRPGHPLDLVGEPNFELRVGSVLEWAPKGSGSIALRVDSIDCSQRLVEILPAGHKGGLTISGADITQIPRGTYLTKSEASA